MNNTYCIAHNDFDDICSTVTIIHDKLMQCKTINSHVCEQYFEDLAASKSDFSYIIYSFPTARAFALAAENLLCELLGDFVKLVSMVDHMAQQECANTP